MKRGLRLLVGREVLGEGRRAWCRRTDSTSSPLRWSESLRRPSRRGGTGHPVAAALLDAGNDRSEAPAALLDTYRRSAGCSGRFPQLDYNERQLSDALTESRNEL